MEYTQRMIARDLGVSTTTVNKAINSNSQQSFVDTLQRVRAYAQKVGYHKLRMVVKPKGQVNCLSMHNYKSKDERKEHMESLRNMGYSNAQIAKITGYEYQTVLTVIGKQPKAFSEANRRLGQSIRRQRDKTRHEMAELLARNNETVNTYNKKVLMCQAEMRKLEAERLELPTDTTVTPLRVMG